ncbi:hypothetical protein BDV36DRAFT_278014 [Aspergillus pseudocaelatus]|uniref:Uncharacterized protein n=1 Tax=Aspergillus pseudocaelatus TaxID=1825620 RepID=A0ABQ6VZQ1_9EURO|nr:hypothetical protein BDV36DRAFT_278014 [Aspergillus pseudocaelatus]
MAEHFAIGTDRWISSVLTGLFLLLFSAELLLDRSIYYASDRVAVRMGTQNPFRPKKPMRTHI